MKSVRCNFPTAMSLSKFTQICRIHDYWIIYHRIDRKIYAVISPYMIIEWIDDTEIVNEIS